MPETGKERREGPDWFATLCEQVEQLGERLNQEHGDYAAYSSIMDTIGEAEAEREAALAKARKEGREEVLQRLERLLAYAEHVSNGVDVLRDWSAEVRAIRDRLTKEEEQ